MPVGYTPGHPVRKFKKKEFANLKNTYNTHGHSVTHAACAASGAVYAADTAITSTTPDKTA